MINVFLHVFNTSVWTVASGTTFLSDNPIDIDGNNWSVIIVFFFDRPVINSVGAGTGFAAYLEGTSAPAGPFSFRSDFKRSRIHQIGKRRGLAGRSGRTFEICSKSGSSPNAVYNRPVEEEGDNNYRPIVAVYIYGILRSKRGARCDGPNRRVKDVYKDIDHDAG